MNPTKNLSNQDKINKIRNDIRIYAINAEEIKMAVIQEQVTYGTLDRLLGACKRFDDFDALFITKYFA